MTLDNEIFELKRELTLRKKCYPDWVHKKKMTQTQADNQIALLKSAIESLVGLKFFTNWFTVNHPDLLQELGLGGAIMCVLENYRINQGKLQYLRTNKEK